MKETIFISEDLPGVTLHRGVRGRLYASYAFLLRRAVLGTLRSYLPGLSVLSNSFLEEIQSLFPKSLRFVSSNYVTSKSLAVVDMPPLIQFHRRLMEEFAKECPQVRRPVIEAVSNRVVLDGLLEHVARPAEAYWRFLQEETGAREVLLLSGNSHQEEIAGDVARHLGLSVKTTAWRSFFGPFFMLKRLLLHKRDGLPSVEALRNNYSGRDSQTPYSRNADVAFFCVDERRIRRLTETMRRLCERGCPVVLGALNVKKEVESSLRDLTGTGVKVDSLNHFLPMHPAGDPQSLFREAESSWISLFSRDSSLADLEYRGVSLGKFCKARLTRPWAKFSVEADLFYRAASNWLSLASPKLVLVSDISLHSIILTRLCEERGIPTIFYIYNPVLFTVAYWPKLLFEAMRTRWVFTANSHMAEKYRTEGEFPPERTRIVGDVYASPVTKKETELERSQLRAQLGLAPDTKLVLALSFFVGPDLSETQKRKYFRCVSRGIRELENTRLVVKAHPNEDKGLLQKMLAEEGLSPVLVAHTESLRKLLLASDAACIVYSQAGMEIVMTEVPLVIIQDQTLLKGFEDWVPYVREGAAVFVDENESLADKLRPLLFDPEQRRARLQRASEFCERYITSMKINPIETMAAAVESALAETDRA